MSRLATPLRGLDGESAVTLAGLKAHDAVFIARYLSNNPAKNLTPGEAEAYARDKVGFFTVWEDAANAAEMGYDQGRSDAEQHLAMAKQCGYKEGTGMLTFAVDFDPPNPAVTDAYFNGVASVIPKEDCGPYGGIAVVQHQYARGFRGIWQTLAWSETEIPPGEWYQGRYVSANAKVYQQAIVDFGYDSDLAFFDDYGQWDFVAPPPPDPNHYERYPSTPYPLKNNAGKMVPFNEQKWAKWWDKEYAALKKAPHDKTLIKSIAATRPQIIRIRDRIWTVAHDHNPSPLPKGWSHNYLGWRWQEWDKRMKLA